MYRLLRVHGRGAPSSLLRPAMPPFRPPASFPFTRLGITPQILAQRTFTCQFPLHARHTRNPFARLPRPPFVLTVAAAATLPLVANSPNNDLDDAEDDQDLTLEQSLLDTSERELKHQKYGISQERSLLYRLFRSIKIAFLRYVHEPIATGLRFVQLVVIFVPVLVTIPVIFLGARVPDRDNERSGTLWWYQFLVKQMERAGATFIKVGLS